MSPLLLILAACTPDKPTDSADPAEEADTDTDTDSDTDTDTDSDTDTDTDTDVVPQSIAMDDPGIRYVGRWDLRDAVAPVVGWQGGSLELVIDGTGLRADLDPGAGTEYFRVIIDGDGASSEKLAIEPGRGWHTLASGLVAGEHHVELVRETYYRDNVTLHGLEVDGIGLGTLPPAKSRRIEFYGDSNLAGSSLESERNRGGGSNDGSHFTYAGIVARMFDAEYQNISYSGATIGDIHGLYRQVEWYDASLEWDFDAQPADVVVVNLGANDVGAPEASIREAYAAFLTDLRETHPGAHVVLFNGWGWDYDEPAGYTDSVAAAQGDDNLSVATFPWLFEQWHGCEYDHAGMASVLAAHLESVMGWTASEPDVMSGFGVGGDVANGSFESTAPFGGYGWRYRDEAGVSRVEGGAHDGDRFLRLSDGAATHQPVPGLGVFAVTATMWVRGSGSGSDAATVTIDFRDQEMYTAPLDTQQWTITPGETWEEVSFSAAAPFNTSKPVYNIRLTIEAGEDASVDVDAVSMQSF